MIRKIYLIRDTALDSYLVPMFFQSEGAARRAFTDEVNRAADDNIMYNHPEHFQLFCAGDYDDDIGLFHTMPPEFVVAAHSVRVP
ncbi:MAG: nonstructural protein [Microvirus sp.]|nr:MAG: nonstructural protein [Microvirus sp.]